MNSMESAAQFLGIPSGAKKKPKLPVRRGTGGRHAGKAGPSAPAKTPEAQHAAIGAHLKAGNLPAAKSATLMLAKALHAKTGSSKPPMAPAAPIGGAVAAPPDPSGYGGM